MPPPADSRPRSRRPRHGALVPAIATATLAVGAYISAIGNPFVFDDYREVVENSSIESLSSPARLLAHTLTRPVVTLSYAVDYAVWGWRDPFGYHVTNVALHALNVLLLFLLVYRATRDRGPAAVTKPDDAAVWAAFAASALWAVHPLMTEAVGYVSSRSELLCGTFLLTSLICFLRAFPDVGEAAGTRAFRPAPLGWLVAATGSFLLALGSREIAVVLPAVLLAYDALVRTDARAARRSRFWRLHAPLLGLVAMAGLTRVWMFVGVEYAEAGRATWSSALTGVHAVARYLELLAAPVGLSLVPPIYPVTSVLDPRFVVPAVVLVGLIAAAALLRRRSPLVSFGIAWFFLFLLPSSALTLLSEFGQTMAEHRAYLASAGIFMAAGTLLARWVAVPGRSLPARRVAAAGLGLVLAVLMAMTVARNRVWADPVRLWADAERHAPSAWLAVHGLADAHRQAGDCQSAIPVYTRALPLGPGKAETYVGLASCFAETGRTQDAGAILRLAISRLPNNTDLKLRLAGLEERAFGDPGRALTLCQEVLAVEPQSREASDCVRRIEQRRSIRGR